MSASRDACSLLRWNVLTDSCYMMDWHDYCPRSLRNWERRRALIFSFVEYTKASLVCMQELDPDCYKFLKKSWVLWAMAVFTASNWAWMANRDLKGNGLTLAKMFSIARTHSNARPNLCVCVGCVRGLCVCVCVCVPYLLLTLSVD